MTITVLLVLLIATLILFVLRSRSSTNAERSEITTIDDLVATVKESVIEIIQQPIPASLSYYDYDQAVRRKDELKKDLAKCTNGYKESRESVIALVRSIIEQQLPTKEHLYNVYDFDRLMSLDYNTMFELLLIMVKKKLVGEEEQAINYLDKYYNIIEAIGVETDKDDMTPILTDLVEHMEDFRVDIKERHLLFTEEKLRYIFQKEVIDVGISEADMYQLLAIVVYQKYKGFGCVDTLSYQDIDGFELGTSGEARYHITGKKGTDSTDLNSIWMQINAKWVHLSFMHLGDVGELRRIVKLLSSTSGVRPLTEKMPIKTSELPDGSRVAAVRPSSSEKWAVFVRKFGITKKSLKDLLDVPEVKNAEIPIMMIYFIMMSKQTAAFTGQQNTGKTTLLKAAIEYLQNANIRVLESMFEMGLNELYPHKNINSFKPSGEATSRMIQDFMKKVDGLISINGEVADDVAAARMIQFAIIASIATYFTHHAKTDLDLINGLVNSLVSSGEFKEHDVALQNVLNVIHKNVHLDFAELPDGRTIRIVEYISRIEPLEILKPYPKVRKARSSVEAIQELTSIQREFFTRTTDRVRFKSENVVEFNRETLSYEAGTFFSDNEVKEIMKNLNADDKVLFLEFYKKYWVNKKSA